MLRNAWAPSEARPFQTSFNGPYHAGRFFVSHSRHSHHNLRAQAPSGIPKGFNPSKVFEMTNPIAVALVLLIFAGLAADLMMLDGQTTLLLARKFVNLVEWVAFWR